MNKRQWTKLTFGRHYGKTLPEVLLWDPNYFFWGFANNVFKGPLFREAKELYRRATSIRIPPAKDGTAREALYWGEEVMFSGLELVPEGHTVPVDLPRKKVIDLSVPFSLSPRDTSGGYTIRNDFRDYIFGPDGNLPEGDEACRYFENDDNFVLNKADTVTFEW